MTTQIEVLDKLCGSGKSVSLFKWIRQNQQERYLYITPLLSEIEDRLPKELPDVLFYQPEAVYLGAYEKQTKSDHLLCLLMDGVNIAFTHSLFKGMRKEHLFHIQQQGYIVIVDEECDLIESASDYIKSGDIEFLLTEKCIEIDTDNLGIVKWVKEDAPKKDWKYAQIRALAEMDMLYASKRRHEMLTIHLPIKLITAARRFILSSYMFDGSIMSSFVAMKGINTIPFKDIVLCDKEHKRSVKGLVNIFHPRNEKELDKLSLSVHGATSLKANSKQLSLLNKAIRNVALYHGVKAESVMWTSQKSMVESKHIKPVGLPKDVCFVSCNARATNDYAHKTVLIHAFDRYPNQVLRSYLEDYGFPISSDRYALAELIQWVFRSAIRKGENIFVYVVAKRMREMFIKWINSDE